MNEVSWVKEFLETKLPVIIGKNTYNLKPKVGVILEQKIDSFLIELKLMHTKSPFDKGDWGI